MKQKTLFACLAAFAAVFAFSACDGFGDGSVPIDDYVIGNWTSNSWDLGITSSGFTLRNIYTTDTYTGNYFGWVEDGGTEGELNLSVYHATGPSVKEIDSIELEYRKSGSRESLTLEEVFPSEHFRVFDIYFTRATY